MKAVSVFCGAGGLDMGFSHAGVDIVLSIDSSKDACETHRLWGPEGCECRVVTRAKDFTYDDIPDCDILLGNIDARWKDRVCDSPEYDVLTRLVHEKHPKALVMVLPTTVLFGGDIPFEERLKWSLADHRLENRLKGHDYKVYVETVNASDFSVPQNRERAVVVCLRWDVEKPFVMRREGYVRLTMGDVLSGVPVPSMDDVCTAEYSPRYMSRNRWRGFDDVSFTIPGDARQVPLYPGSPPMEYIGRETWAFGPNGSTRRLSWQEAAAIQTFPIGMEFHGSLASKYSQIGNSVPVRLADAVAGSVLESLS